MNDSAIARAVEARADARLAAQQDADERADRLAELADERADRIVRTATPEELGELLVNHDLIERADAVLRVLLAHASLVVVNTSTPQHIRMARELRGALVECIAKDLMAEAGRE